MPNSYGIIYVETANFFEQVIIIIIIISDKKM